MNKKHGIIFDFDGVIIDSFDITYEVVLPDNPGLTKAQLRKAFEMHFYDAVNKHTFVLDSYHKEFSKRIPDIPLQENARDMLDELAASYELHIVSSNFEDIIQGVLAEQNIDTFFSSVLGWNASKYKSEKFRHVFEKRDAEDFLFITDTSGDIGEAHQVNLPTLGYTQGFHSRSTLEKARPHGIIDTLEHVNKFL